MERRDRVVLENMCMVQDGSKVLVEDKIGKDIRGIIFPGGHVEENEPIVDSVIREVKEETGLTIKNPTLCGVKNWIDDDGTRYIVFLFKAEEYSGTLTSSSEGQVFWVEKDEVLNLPWIWGMDNIMRILVDREYSEFYMNAKNGWTPVMM
jgi:8-oxo-dGTP diphosphatase